MKDEIDKHKITKKKINGKRFSGQCMNNYEYVDDFNR